MELNETFTKEKRETLGQLVECLSVMDKTREISLAITKLQEARMWLGVHLGNVGGKDLNAERDAKAGYPTTGRGMAVNNAPWPGQPDPASVKD